VPAADGVRLPKEAYFVVSTMFRGDPQVHIIGHWSYPAGTKKDVFVTSNAERVELFVNGTSLGEGVASDKYLFTWKDVAFVPGEIKAVAFRGDNIVSSQTKLTAGSAVALKLTALTAPGGLRADGSDVALIDVEAVDAKGQRVPTFQQRVTFETGGPAIWRGGYNSGRIHSTNHTSIDLEAGINRVAIRASRDAGMVTVRAESPRLRSASVSIAANAFAARNGMSVTMPATLRTPLPASAPPYPMFTTNAPSARARTTPNTPSVGNFITRFGYTGPTAAIVHVETMARDGRNVYVDRDDTFRDLPAELVGADWVQIADADQRYNAVDLIELAVKGGSVITIAHDARVPAPGWLAKQFEATERTIQITGQNMRLYTRLVPTDASITLGANYDSSPTSAVMYVVFVNKAM
jgi:beta-galactosidase